MFVVVAAGEVVNRVVGFWVSGNVLLLDMSIPFPTVALAYYRSLKNYRYYCEGSLLVWGLLIIY